MFVRIIGTILTLCVRKCIAKDSKETCFCLNLCCLQSFELLGESIALHNNKLLTIDECSTDLPTRLFRFLTNIKTYNIVLVPVFPSLY